MEAEPRALEFTGEEIHRVSHAYGTNGIITEVELPTAPLYDWVHLLVQAQDFADATRFAYDLAGQDGLLIKLATVFEPPVGQDYFQRVSPHLAAGATLLAFMVAPHAMTPFETFLARWGGIEVIHRSDAPTWPKDPGPVFEYGWNHTTLRALKVDPSITYLQCAFGTERPLELVAEARARFSPEVLHHLEVTRQNGRVALGGLSLVRFTSEARLDRIVAEHEAMGVQVFNPHRYTLEEGGRQRVDDVQLAFKREADPKGLLNPGKMIAWDDPGWRYDRMYAYPGLARAAE
jgi:FAD/FMN-containing dehydrogenase